MADGIRYELVKALMTVAFGILSGASYDVLRALRRTIPHCVTAVSVEDILYWLAMTAGTFAFLIRINDGGVRFYFVAGALAGIALYEITVGKAVLKIMTLIIEKIPVAILKKTAEFIKMAVSGIRRRSNEKKRKKI